MRRGVRTQQADPARQRIKQSAFLYGASLGSLGVSVIVSIVNARVLGLELFGDFRFLLNLFTFVTTCLTFGLFASGGRLIASESDVLVRRRLYGALCLSMLALAVAYMAVFAAISNWQGEVLGNSLGPVIRISLPLLFAYPIQVLVSYVLKGDNRIYTLSIYKLLPGPLYLACVYVWTMYKDLSLPAALYCYLGAIFVAGAMAVVSLRPRFDEMAASMARLLAETRSYGRHVYVGVLAGTATTQLAGLTVAYYLNNAAVGIVLLAQTLTVPLTMVASTIGTVYFKEFTRLPRISGRVFLVTAMMTMLAVLFYDLLIGRIVGLLYPNSFGAVGGLAQIMAIGAGTLGIGEFVNNFVCAKGGGKMARNAAFVRGIVNVAGFLFLVKIDGMRGAALTTVLAALAHLAVIGYYYAKIVGMRGAATEPA